MTFVCPQHPRNADGDVGYFVKLSDIHMDPLYKIGSNALCSDPLCCRDGVCAVFMFVPIRMSSCACDMSAHNTDLTHRHIVTSLFRVTQQIQEKCTESFEVLFVWIHVL